MVNFQDSLKNPEKGENIWNLPEHLISHSQGLLVLTLETVQIALTLELVQIDRDEEVR